MSSLIEDLQKLSQELQKESSMNKDKHSKDYIFNRSNLECEYLTKSEYAKKINRRIRKLLNKHNE